MHEQVRISLKKAIVESLSILQPLTVQNTDTEPYLFWRRSGDQGWHGEYRYKPSLRNVFSKSAKSLNAIGVEFLKLFKLYYPGYDGLVGFRSHGQEIILERVLNNMLIELYNRHGTFQCAEPVVDSLIEEFEEFVDLPTVRVRYMAQLLNFRMEGQQIDFPGDMVIRRLSEEEVSEIHGGLIWVLQSKPSSGGSIHEYIVEGEYEEPKIFGNEQVEDTSAFNEPSQKINKALLTLRTFKEGPTGYDWVRFKSVKFCPLSLPALLYGDWHVPLGRYAISEHEVADLQRHAELIFSTSESSMQMACSRLADAQIRFRAEDRLVDAVIGLETLLLAGLGKEDRRGELRYRFALNYSCLYSSPEERYQHFHVARDLYDLRSAIVHGGMSNENRCPLGGKKMILAEAAQQACKILRDVIKHFLPETNGAPYKKSEFWQRKYFGLPLKP